MPDRRERREIQSLGKFGTLDQFQFTRLGLGAMMMLPTFFFGAFTFDTIRLLVRGLPVDHVVERSFFALLTVGCAVLAVRLLVRTILQIRLTATGQKALGKMTEIERRSNGTWRCHYQFTDAQGNVRTGRLAIRNREWEVGDAGEVYYGGRWAGSRWISESIRELPPPESPPSIKKFLGGMLTFMVLLALIGSAAMLLAWGGLVQMLMREYGLLIGSWMVILWWLVLAAFLVPVAAILALCLGPLVAAGWAVVDDAFID